MLHIITGDDRLCNTQRLIETICERAEQGIGGQILIVPEQYSHEAERALCAAGGDSISRYAEVLSFTRLASRVFSLYGGVCEEYLDKGGRLLCVYRAVDQVRSRLKYYASISTKPEFLQRLGAAMEEFLACCLQPQDLALAAERVGGRFAQKLTELGLIFESYLSVCASGKSDPVTRLQRLCELLQQTDFASEHTFYLDGFSDFTTLEQQIVTELLRRSEHVYLALTTDGTSKSVFRAAEQTRKAVRQSAARWNVQDDCIHIDGSLNRCGELRSWLGGLFAATAQPWNGAVCHVGLHKTDSAEKECQYALYQVRKLLQSGKRCRDICIAVTDRDVYEPILRPLFARCGIPAYYAGSSEIAKLPLICALFAALEAAERYDYEDVLVFLKSSISPLDTEACDELEQYAYRWSIRGSQWDTPWQMHPAGYGEPWDERYQAQLARLNEMRQTGIEPLSKLRSALRAAKNVAQMVLALNEFLQQLQLSEKLQIRTQQLQMEGDAQQAQQMRQLYEILLQAMEQMYATLGSCVMTPQQFTDVFRMLLEQYQVGTIPAAVDQVQVAAVDMFRYKCTDTLIVLGAQEGKFPAFSAGLGVFTDEERQRLLAMGLRLSPAQEQKMDWEQGCIYAALCAAQQRVILCCGAAEPSFLFQKTQMLLPQLSISDAPVPFAADARDAAAKLLRAGEAPPAVQEVSEWMQLLRERAEYDFTKLQPSTVHGLYGNEIALSASRIDRFAGCRYAFFLQYGLKAQPWKQAKFDAPVFGTFVHYVLEKTVMDVMQRGGFAAVTEEVLLTLAKQHAEEYTRVFLPDLMRRGERFSYLYARNMREVLEVVTDVGRELRVSRFEPRNVELPFARNGLVPPVRVETSAGCSVLSGYVDRVDVYETEHGAWYRVVDYKTGHKEFDYTDLLCGEGLQMLIYLFALKAHGEQLYGREIRPAGVLYVPARADMERLEPGSGAQALEELRTKHRKRKGLVLHDEQLLQAMEQTDGEVKYLPYQIKKSGLSGDLATREQMQLLEQFVTDRLREMTERILSGEIAPNPIIRGPIHSSCQYCDFAQVCHMDTCMHENRYRAAVKADVFWKELERRQRNV